MRDIVIEGPPFGEFVDPDEEYVRGQGTSQGSGALGGWSQANLGGFFELERSPSREVREELHKLARPSAACWPATGEGADTP
jgi:hypothetical protein